MSDRLTVLQIAQDALGAIGMGRPTTVINTSDDASIQLERCIHETALHMLRKHDWEDMKISSSFTTIAQENQGDIRTKFPDYTRLVNDSIWNETTQRKLHGPISSQIWREAKATGRVFVEHQMFRLIGGDLYILGQSAADEVIALEYISNRWLQTADGLDRRARIVKNTDVCLLHSQVMTLGVKARWLYANGQDSSSAMAEYADLLATIKAEDGGKDVLSLVPPRQRRMTYPYDVAVRNYE
jgi:hypothetical protein